VEKRLSRSRLARIKLLLLDVDGVMTDGGIYYSEKGEELKKFNIHDGYGVVKIQRLGIPVGIITGRASEILKRRAAELGIHYISQNREDKRKAYEEIKSDLNLFDEEIAYVGDDEPDLPVLRLVGFSAAPASAVESVKKSVDYVCRCKGGEGAVREVVELLCGARNAKR
jgi:3-deoxy-D-manno-octulosonate 8-phosphate phosphatase (KDO 8-P phosphatase)